jgi:hypothetical protein
MSIKLLPASVDSVDPSQASGVTTSLVPLTQRAITTRAGQSSLVPSTDAFVWSSSTRQSQPKFIDGTPVEDPQGAGTGDSDWEYLPGWSWSHSVESMVIAHYLSYGAGLAIRSGRLIDVYA